MTRNYTTILVLEDNPEDFEVIVRGFHKAGLRNGIVHCSKGDDVIDYLYRRGAYAGPGKARPPGMILLDLNVPGTDGRTVLDKIKSHEDFKAIPVIVFTSSADLADVDRCYSAGANGYIQKPEGLKGFLEVIRRLKEYWLETSILPGISQSGR
jgi:CheY-like chemotaxis protein